MLIVMTNMETNVYPELYADHPWIVKKIAPIAAALIGKADVAMQFGIKGNGDEFETTTQVSITTDGPGYVATFGYNADSYPLDGSPPYTCAEIKQNFVNPSNSSLFCITDTLVSAGLGLVRRRIFTSYDMIPLDSLEIADGETVPDNVRETARLETYHDASKLTVVTMACATSKLAFEPASR